MNFVILIVGAYLLGSIPFGLIIAKAHGRDLRSIGSGNIGATNVLRTGRRWLAALTLLGDYGKGLAAVTLASLWGEPLGLLAGLGAFLGHLYPFWLRFKGGRVVDAGASKNEDFLFQMMDQDRGGRTLGELAIGTNYWITKFTRNTLFDEKIGGTVHMALGAAYPESGGKNKSALHWDLVCDLRKGGRIEVDGKVIARNGKFLRAAWPQPVRRR